MNKSRYFRRLRVLDAFVVAFTLVGCIEVGGSDEGSNSDGCNDDNDCKNGQVCNDGECEAPGGGGTNGGASGSSTGGTGGGNTGGSNTGGSNTGGGNTGGSGTGGASTGGSSTGGAASSCDSFCDFGVLCGDATAAECLTGCEQLYGTGGACRAAFDSFAQCVRAYGNDCAAVQQSCTSQANSILSSCADCPYTDDGECDEPEGTDLCAEGTDANDCAVGGVCVDGSAGNTCPFSCDMECDEPQGTDLCSAGTDTWDCARYP